jgi:hypothetical protein
MNRQLQQLLSQAGALGGGNMPGIGGDQPTQDTSEHIHISSLALLKVIFV